VAQSHKAAGAGVELAWVARLGCPPDRREPARATRAVESAGCGSSEPVEESRLGDHARGRGAWPGSWPRRLTRSWPGRLTRLVAGAPDQAPGRGAW